MRLEPWRAAELKEKKRAGKDSAYIKSLSPEFIERKVAAFASLGLKITFDKFLSKRQTSVVHPNPMVDARDTFEPPKAFEGKREEDQPQTCAIVHKLPTDIYLPIWRQLGPRDQWRFAQTCAAFKNLPHACSEHSEDYFLGPNQVAGLKNLVVRAKRFPTQWACDCCMRIHNIELNDTPSNARRMELSECPRVQQHLCILESFVHPWPEHRHVMLSLKMNRLGQQGHLDSGLLEYFNRLMRPYTCDLPPPDHDIPHLPFFDTSHVHVEPKIISSRYLVGITYRMERRTYWEDDLYEKICIRYCDHRDDYAIPNMLGEAMEHMGQEFEISCRRCRSDFSAVVMEDRAEIKMWHDLGGEHSVRLDWPAFPGVGGLVAQAMTEHKGEILGDRLYKAGTARRIFEDGHDCCEHALVDTWMQM